MKELNIPVEGEKRLCTKFRIHIGTVNKKRQRNAAAPNVIHSFDVAHMMVTIDKCKEAEVEDFALVHDSFGTHPSSVDVLQFCLREPFLDIYTSDRLQVLERQWVAELFEHAKDFLPEMPTPPQNGTWNATDIMDAEYFFG